VTQTPSHVITLAPIDLMGFDLIKSNDNLMSLSFFVFFIVELLRMKSMLSGIDRLIHKPKATPINDSKKANRQHQEGRAW
jgi:hypothetical protein